MKNFNNMETTTKGTIRMTSVINSNFAVVRDKDIGSMLFGCPPEVVKYFNREKEPIPPYIVIPQRTFRKGKNCFDLEFVAYTVIFFQQNKNPINIVCTKTQENRMRIVLNEALFGPVLKDMFQSVLSRYLGRLSLSRQQVKSLEMAAERMGENREIFLRFKEIISRCRTKRKALLEMQTVLRRYLEEISWFGGLAHDRIYRYITEAYVKAAMLKHEMNVFATCDEDKHDEFVNKFVNFHHFDSEGKVMLDSGNGAKFKICQALDGHFRLYKKGKLAASFALETGDGDEESIQVAKAPMEMPEFGITFVGSGTGFDPETYTSCFIIWINGKAIAVDLVANCEAHFRRLGFASSYITHIFLSHLHADHDAGIIEKIMIGEKTRLLTSGIIFDSFLRKAEALTRFTKENIKDFVYFTNLEDGKEIRIPGIERAYITFDYAFHSIPAGRFKLRYKRQDGREVKIGFSGDTKYNKELVNKLYREGKITAGRRNKILGFLWDCDLIIHEAGGGVLHTKVEDLAELPARLRKRCILTHTDKKTRKIRGFHFAREGETITIFKKKSHHLIAELIPLMKSTGLFPRFTSIQFRELLQGSPIRTFSSGQYIFKQDDVGHKFYIILSGFAEVIKNKKVIAIYDKGDFFGELALISKDKKRRASVRAKSKLTLLCIDRSIYKKFHITTLIQERMYEFVNYFSDSTPSSLIGHISQGEFMIFQRGDEIITYGDTSRDVYILISGEVDVTNFAGEIIAHVTDVEVLGEIAFLKQMPRTATVRVSSKQAIAICLNIKIFTEIYEKFPSFYATVLKKMDRRLEAFEKRASTG